MKLSLMNIGLLVLLLLSASISNAADNIMKHYPGMEPGVSISEMERIKVKYFGLNKKDAKPGCTFTDQIDPSYTSPNFQNPEEAAPNGDGIYTLNVQYGENTIGDCAVKLRSYNGGLVGPTFRVKPGDTLEIDLKNMLPSMDDEDKPALLVYNTTNFHSHGFYVSPAANSDNVLLSVEPRDNHRVEIKIPKDHPPGTFWYHAHQHSSTAMQVSSGMVGMLIVEGGIDELDKIKNTEERIMVFQQPAYDEQGVLEDYDLLALLSDSALWEKARRYTLINGQLIPVIRMRPGEVNRFRMVHAGVRETLNITLGNANAGSMHVIAHDGLVTGRIDPVDHAILQPGYRLDVMFKATMDVGLDGKLETFLIDDVSNTKQSLNSVQEPAQVLAKIVIEGTPKDQPLPLASELQNYVPHNTITNKMLEESALNTQYVTFWVGFGVCDSHTGLCSHLDCDPESNSTPNCARQFMLSNDRNDNLEPGETPAKRKLKMNWHIFNHSRVNRFLPLTKYQQWKLAAVNSAHPFHIHVNPFQQIIELDTNQEPKEWIWRDVFLVPGSEDGAADTYPIGRPAELRTHYQRYLGRFVMHCHNLFHEDKGMMEIMETVLPSDYNAGKIHPEPPTNNTRPPLPVKKGLPTK